MIKTCVQCGKTFAISDSEINFYKSKNLSIPKRCKDCRKKNKSDSGSPQKSSSTQYNSYYVRRRNTKSLSTVVIAVIIAAISIVLKADSSFTIAISATALFTLIKYVISLRNSKIFIQEFDTSLYEYTFHDTDSMVNHYVKHGHQTKSESMEDYLFKANMVIKNRGNLSKKQKDEDDTVFYNPHTKEFVVIAKSGYIRTYYIASGIKYYNKQ